MTPIIITLFSDKTVRLSDEDSARVLAGDHPIRVKSKVLATIRELASQPGMESIVGFLPVVKECMDYHQHYPILISEDITQDHYGDLALYLAPELPCRIVSDLLLQDKDSSLVCREDFVRGSSVIVISDACSDWKDVVSCLEAAGAHCVKCVSILQK